METKKQINSFLKVAINAATVGSDILLKGFGRKLKIKLKGPTDPVTERDLKSEKAIRKIISKNFPDHSILAEEGDYVQGSSLYRWYIDPLDGTANYIHQNPYFAVSIGCARVEPDKPPEMLAGVVLAPVLREMFWATKAGGAFSHRVIGEEAIKRKLKVSSVDNPIEAYASVGHPYEFHQKPMEFLDPIKRLCRKLGGIRHNGSAALDLCAVAAGRSEAYFEANLKPWDVAAGIIIVNEALGVVTDRAGATYQLESGSELLASNQALAKEFVAILNSEDK
ncbi:MAG: inositol monophosphatase [Deltaproteobacteria bacterium]|jgi:myo-inositol-1(or 4)-monophosphatase|nr:inositol monophosphatase [Deltaproteobacteria bacterium]